ncbi:Ion channel [Ancylostoma caninum]|uniref:Ion channel n=1 Tax=Ancylostoma caninum TaxID=29170 RepID=A0A368GX68_ANCCA|nr:Ion channel [Ancylostoma caninum]
MLFLVLLYTLLGAALFFSIESRYERKTVANRKVALDAKIEVIAEQLRQLYNNSDAVIDRRLLERFVKDSYIDLLKEESLFTESTYYKAEDPANFKWTYPSAIFFSMNVYTTTGYGSIAPDSTLGRFCVICYSLVTIPVTLVVVRDLGQWTLVILTKGYAHILVAFRRSMGYSEPHEDTMIALPMKFCLSLLAGYTLFAATFICIFDEWNGDIPGSGLPFFTSFYFSYISITTIGLGDIMPNNATVS